MWDSLPLSSKFLLLEELLNKISHNTDVLVLPAGFFNAGKGSVAALIENISRRISKLTIPNKLHICLGIDGKHKKEQLAIVIRGGQTIAKARKFYHMDGSVKLATSPYAPESGLNRFFPILNCRAYLAVCYDAFGIIQLRLENKGFDFVINCIHGFASSGGDSDFARKGLAGVAKEWGVNVYASALFAENRSPINFPAGITWRLGSKSVTKCTYDDIRLTSKNDIVEISLGKCFLQYFSERGRK